MASPPDSSSSGGKRKPLLLPKAVWVADADVTHCTICNSAFTALNRRHHCRRCGKIFCNNCASKKILLPLLGYTKSERVCDRCFETSRMISYAVSENVPTQLVGVQDLYEYVKNNSSLEELTEFGIIDVILYCCTSPELEVATLSITAIDHHITRLQNSWKVLMEKGVVNVLIELCMMSIPNPTILYRVSKIFVFLSKESSIAEQIVEAGALPHIIFLASFHSDVGNITSVQKYLSDTQAFASRAIAHLAVNDMNQKRILEDEELLSSLIKLLSSENVTVQRYVAKTIAYLSLRNDKLKSRILPSNGIDLLMNLLINPQTPPDTLSHLCCAVANLATSDDSQRILINDERLLKGLTSIQSKHFQDIEIMRHIARGFANFALYPNNKLKIKPILTYIVQLGDANSAEIQRHAVRAIDNLLSTEITTEDIQLMEESGAIQLLTQVASDTANMTPGGTGSVQKRAAAALKKLSEAKEGEHQTNDAAETTTITTTSTVTETEMEAEAGESGRDGSSFDVSGMENSIKEVETLDKDSIMDGQNNGDDDGDNDNNNNRSSSENDLNDVNNEDNDNNNNNVQNSDDGDASNMENGSSEENQN